jgi:hypothetical protein
MKGYLFLVLVVVLIVVAYNYKVEGFKNDINVPTNVPEAKTVNVSSPDPYMEPAENEYGPPFGDIAKVNTLPYKDPAQESASYKSLVTLKESLMAFLGFEAKGLQETSDPAVQLPLSTLRSDYQRVTDETDVLKRNPGINSQLTVDSLNEIQANLNYLQKKYRLSVNSTINEVEGFEDTQTRASLQDVKDALAKIKAEIIRMSASGTTDPILVARTNVLTKISQRVQTIIDEVNRGDRTFDQIHIMKSDLVDFLKSSSDVASPVSNFINENNLPVTLANLFPAYKAGDISGAKITQYLFNTYADTLAKGLSWNLGVKYTSPNEAAAGSSRGSVSGTTLSGTGITSAFDALSADSVASSFSSPNTFARGELENTTNPSSRDTNDSSSKEPSHYDWKAKSSQICEAIRKRGLKPGDFGCLETASSVGSDYSWRGNARMVCTRLQSSYDPGLPDYCGCPPVDWAGWRA